jgi:hypothetical protein
MLRFHIVAHFCPLLSAPVVLLRSTRPRIVVIAHRRVRRPAAWRRTTNCAIRSRPPITHHIRPTPLNLPDVVPPRVFRSILRHGWYSLRENLEYPVAWLLLTPRPFVVQYFIK